ncbi:MAG: LPD7 domain-containing protein [Pseudomonadota bacterium]
MNTVTEHSFSSADLILLELQARSIEEVDAVAAQAEAGPILPGPDAQVGNWVTADIAAVRQLDDQHRQAVLMLVAANTLASRPYQQKLAQLAPEIADSVRPLAQATQIAYIVAGHLSLAPGDLQERVRDWTELAVEFFSKPDHFPLVQAHVEQLLGGISPDSINAFLTSARDAIAKKRQEADRSSTASPTAQSAPWLIPDEEQAHEIARVIRANANMMPWKIEANLRREHPATITLLADTARMRALDNAVANHLSSISHTEVASVHAVIARALHRSDAQERARAAADAAHVPSQQLETSKQDQDYALSLVADFIASTHNLTREAMIARAENAPPMLRDILSDTRIMGQLDEAINERFSFLSPTRIADVQAAIAAAFDRSDAEHREQLAQSLRDPKPTERPIDEPSAELVQRVVDFFATAVNLRREKIAQHLADAPSDLQALLANADQVKKLDSVIDTRLTHIPAVRLATVHAVIASTLGRPDASEWRDAERQLKKQARPSRSARAEAALKAEGDARAVADFIATNLASQAWKVEASLDRASPALRAILADADRMRTLAPHIEELLYGLDALHVLETQATIAGALHRPDYGEIYTKMTDLRRASAITAVPDLQSPSAAIAFSTPTPAPSQAEKPARPADTKPASKAASSTRNGIVPSSGTLADTSPIIKKLLEDMSYKVRADGSVLYQVQGKDAFVDHGDQLLMVKGADTEERALLGALMLAKEKYGGAFELTGDEAFKRFAIEVMIKYKLDVHLKNPEQDAMRRDMVSKPMPQQFPAATPQRPAVPIDLSAALSTGIPPAAQQGKTPDTEISSVPVPAPPVTQESTTASSSGGQDSISGTIIRHGQAPYLHIPDNKTSYFVELKDATGQTRSAWGMELRDALRNAGAAAGDDVHLQFGSVAPAVGANSQSPQTKRPHREQGNVWTLAMVARSQSQSTPGDVTAEVSASVTPASPPTPRPATRSTFTAKPARPQEESQTHQTPSVDRLSGKLLRHGHAPYQHIHDNNENYFVELENSDGQVHTQWGKELQHALCAVDARVGDEISMKNPGKKPVTVDEIVRDKTGKAIGVQPLETYRNKWEITIRDRSAPEAPSDDQQVEVTEKIAVPTEKLINRLEGRLLRHGPAPLKNAANGKPSYFVEIENADGRSKVSWGIDLARALELSGARSGDHVVLQNLGRKPIQVDMPARDSAGNITGLRKGVSHRNQWEVEVIQQTNLPKARSDTTPAPVAVERLVPVREAAWWERQIAFTREYVEHAPELLNLIAKLGARPPLDNVAWIDISGQRQVVVGDTTYAALRDRMPNLSAASRFMPVIQGGSLDSQQDTPALSLVRAGDGYLQGIALVGQQLRHVVALLNCDKDGQGGEGNSIVPLMAATPTNTGLTWSMVGYGRVADVAHQADSVHAPSMVFEIGQRVIEARVDLPVDDPLRQRLGLRPSDHHSHTTTSDALHNLQAPPGTVPTSRRPSQNRPIEKYA